MVVVRSLARYPCNSYKPLIKMLTQSLWPISSDLKKKKKKKEKKNSNRQGLMLTTTVNQLTCFCFVFCFCFVCFVLFCYFDNSVAEQDKIKRVGCWQLLF